MNDCVLHTCGAGSSYVRAWGTTLGEKSNDLIGARLEVKVFHHTFQLSNHEEIRKRIQKRKIARSMQADDDNRKKSR